MTTSRRFDLLDQAVFALDTGLRTLLNNPAVTGRDNPADDVAEKDLSADEKKHIAGLMRINHCGEVCAQGLYTGQALTARSAEVREKMQESADEENDHLAWTAERIEAMDSHLVSLIQYSILALSPLVQQLAWREINGASVLLPKLNARLSNISMVTWSKSRIKIQNPVPSSRKCVKTN